MTIGQLRARLAEFGPEYDHTTIRLEVMDEELNSHLAPLQRLDLFKVEDESEENLVAYGSCDGEE